MSRRPALWCISFLILATAGTASSRAQGPGPTDAGVGDALVSANAETGTAASERASAPPSTASSLKRDAHLIRLRFWRPDNVDGMRIYVPFCQDSDGGKREKLLPA